MMHNNTFLGNLGKVQNNFCRCVMKCNNCNQQMSLAPKACLNHHLNGFGRKLDYNNLRNFPEKDFNSKNNDLRPTRLESQPSTKINQDDFYEAYLPISGCDIYFVRHGHGPRILFFSYGVLGEIRNSFKKQLTAFDPNVFTSIFWDPPGYGKSYPRGRNFVPYQYIAEDVEIAHDLLQRMGVTQVSMFGWCDGAHLAILFSLKYPSMVEKLIIWGTKATLTPNNVMVFERMRRLSNWSPTARSEVLKSYDNDAEYITSIMNRYVDTINVMFKTYAGNIYKDLLPYVTVPVLVMHSTDDVMVSRQQVMDLMQQLRDCQYHQLSSGGHSYHIKHWQVFNDVSTRFILGEKRPY